MSLLNNPDVMLYVSNHEVTSPEDCASGRYLLDQVAYLSYNDSRWQATYYLITHALTVFWSEATLGETTNADS